MLPQRSHYNHFLFTFANSSKESLHVQRQKKEQREQNLQKAQEESRYVTGACSEKYLDGTFNDFIQKWIEKSCVYSNYWHVLFIFYIYSLWFCTLMLMESLLQMFVLCYISVATSLVNKCHCYMHQNCTYQIQRIFIHATLN